MRVLVTGGAGFLGSHTVIQLVAGGHEPVVVDNFSNAKRGVINRLEQIIGGAIRLHSVDLRDEDKVNAVFSAEQIDAVIHFAGLKAVGESVQRPLKYYRNNLESTFALIGAMHHHGVRKLVFSSSATVYGPDARVPLVEGLPTSATNPYGWTKVMIEQVLHDITAVDRTWRVAVLRYFNPVGAHPSGLIGEDPKDAPSNLMPFIAQVAAGRRRQLHVYGIDYDTPDGSGVRDYIHVEDLAAGHLAALAAVDEGDWPMRVWNLGTGVGTSVLELVHAFEAVIARPLPYVVVARRPGDVARSYADPAKARIELGWRATRSIHQMCADTWRWQQQNPSGYEDD
jgi:UDP-glucose 4-epimerase